MGRPFLPSKLPLPPSSTCSMGPAESSTQMASWWVQALLQGSLVWQTDRQTDWLINHATRSVRIDHIYVHSTGRQCGLIIWAQYGSERHHLHGYAYSLYSTDAVMSQLVGMLVCVHLMLQILKLSGNEIGPSGAEAVARAISDKHHLQELDLNCVIFVASCFWSVTCYLFLNKICCFTNVRYVLFNVKEN